MRTISLLFLPIIGVTSMVLEDLKESQDLQGTWKVIKAEFDERQIPKSEIIGTKIVICSGRLLFVEKGSQEVMGNIFLRPDKKPKWMDVKITAGINKGAHSSFKCNAAFFENLCWGSVAEAFPGAFVQEVLSLEQR